jgi:hypothetical protein
MPSTATACCAAEVLKSWGAGAAPHFPSPSPPAASAPGIEQERQEVLAAVLHELRSNPENPDAAAACLYLLRHLAS